MNTEVNERELREIESMGRSADDIDMYGAPDFGRIVIRILLLSV